MAIKTVSNTVGLTVLKSGILTTVQDLGRTGCFDQGYSPSGALDEFSFHCSNLILSNPVNSPALEITYGICEFRVEVATIIAVTGPDFNLTIDGQTKEYWRSIPVLKGQLISFESSKLGVRNYLAISGGFQTQKIKNSASVNLRERTLTPCRAQDQLMVAKSSISKSSASKTAGSFLDPSLIMKIPENPLTLRLLPTYQHFDFPTKQINAFLQKDYTVLQSSNRSGYFLEAVDRTPIIPKKKSLISEGMTYGAVQIPFSGQPIILLKDRPTIGGYPKIGTVFSLDLFQLAQCRPGHLIRFEMMELATARHLRLEYEKMFSNC